MTAVLDERPPTAPPPRRGRWITDWHPDDPEFWAHTGKRVARRNLVFSIFTEHLGFAIWMLWSVVVLNLANAGLPMTLSETFWLTAVPNLVGASLRLPYTFAVPKFGGRAWTAVSAAFLLIPTTLLATIVPSGWLATQSHSTQFAVLLACAATAGFGGGNFSSSMANISFFYPERHKGFALGLNAAGGNLGVAVAQIVTPLVVIIGVPAAAAQLPRHDVHLAYAGLIWIPFVVAATVCAWLFMDSLTQARSDSRAYVAALRHGQTWLMSILYIGTFGSFIGYSFALPLVIRNTFPEFLAANPFIATYLAGLGFLGALIGSLARPLGGRLADRIGGARVTLWCFLGMAAGTALAIVGVGQHSFGLFFGSYLVIFLLSGAGNGSTYRMIPAIFAALGRAEVASGAEQTSTMLSFKRQAAAVIGLTGAIGAFGGFLVQLVFREASLPVTAKIAAAATPADKLAVAQANADWSVSALWVFLAGYALFAILTWFYYLRKSFAVDRVPSLAHAGI